MNVNSSAIYRTSSGRTIPEIDRDINPLLEKIRTSVKKHLGWRHILIPYSKKTFWTIIKNPITSIYKVGFCTVSAYIIYLLTKGIFAGVEVDVDQSFFNLFSSKKSVRLISGLNLTNGEQSGQFMIDGLALIYVAFKLVFEPPYKKLAGDVINECYKKHLIELFDPKNDLEQPLDNVQLENINRIYKNLIEDLKSYGERPTFQKVLSYKSLEQSDEENIELSEN